MESDISWLCLPFMGGEAQHHRARQRGDFLLPSAYR